tara:strand:- start:3873 stop:4388 length:516 start_codon:yes stop_codon:yes gene_type:complete
MTYSTINPEKSNGGLMTDYILYEDASVFFQVANALPPENPIAGLDDVPVMFRRGAIARRLAVAQYIQDAIAIHRLNEYIDSSEVGQQRSRIEVLAGHILEDLNDANSAEALQSWYVEVYQDDDIVFHGRRPYPKDMDADAIQTWLHREFNAEEYTAMNPQPHPFFDGLYNL